MSDIDVPAGQPGGPSPVPASAELPERLRVHALAKLLSVTSRRVLDTLVALGAPARGAQSSIDRESAVRVADSLGVPIPAGEASTTPADAASAAPDRARHDVEEEDVEEEVAHGASLPLFAPPRPMFLPPEPVGPAQPSPAEPSPRPARDEGGDADGVEARDSDDADAEDSSDGRRRRRRGRRGRGRGRGVDDDGAQAEGAQPEGAISEDDDASPGDDEASAEADDEAAALGGSASGSRRRRRRRRKGSSDDSADSGDENDPPNTVTKIRESRAASDGGDGSDTSGIQGVRGSTRLEAKRQRRRDGRDAGRRRTPVLSEAEFLARRESVERTMVVRQHGERSEIGVLEDGVLVEHFVTSSGGSSLVGNVYLGRVQNVLPSMEAAFVDIGRGRNAVLYAGEVDWDAAGLAGKARRIEQALSSGDNVLVQVTKDPVGHKGARLTTQISLPGRFLVYVPAGGTHGISRKLADTERRRLKDLLREIVPDDAGVIIRTASEGVSQEALERDVRRLQAQWEVVSAKAEAAASNQSGKSKAPELLYEEPDLMIKVVRDQFNEDFSKLVVSGDDAWDTLDAYVCHVAPELKERLHRHVGTTDVFTEHRIDEQLTKALDRKVWLPSGGTLVIDRTEAMTVIDVNTGKFTGSGGNLEETVTRNNLEAAEEIVRQLRLRDIGGIIVVDFIDMVLESNRDLVLRRLTECLGRDRTRHQVAEVTSLGLVQMTRKRIGTGLLEAFSTPCEHCRGRGVVVSTDPVEPRNDPASNGAGARRRGRFDDGGRRRGGGPGAGGPGVGGSGVGGPGVVGVGSLGPVSSGNGGGDRNGGVPSEAGSGREQQHAPVPAAPNGRPVTGAIQARPAEPPAPARPVEPPAPVRPAEPLAPARPAEPPVSARPVPAGPPAPEGTPAPREATSPAPTPQPPSPQPPRPPLPRSPEPLPTPSDDASAPAVPASPPADAMGGEQSTIVSVPAGLGTGESGRPRRRRRVASRPAGPPAGEDPV